MAETNPDAVPEHAEVGDELTYANGTHWWWHRDLRQLDRWDGQEWKPATSEWPDFAWARYGPPPWLVAENAELRKVSTVEGARQSKRHWKGVAREERRRRKAAEAKVARVEAFSRELRSYCSPHGVSVTYADRLDAALDGRDPIDRLRIRLTEGTD